MSDVKVGGWKKYLMTQPGSNQCARGRLRWRIFCLPPTLTSDIFAAHWPKSMFSISFKSSIWFRKTTHYKDWFLFPSLFSDASKSPRNGGSSGHTSWTGNSSNNTTSQASKNHFNSTGPRSANFGSGNLQNSTSSSSISNSYSSSSLVSIFKEKKDDFFCFFFFKLQTIASVFL